MKRMLFSVILATMTIGVLSIVDAHAVNVTLGSQEWRQLTDTRGVSYNQLSGIYGADGKIAVAGSATIGTVDFTGWRWATRNELAIMFRDNYLSTFAIGGHVSEAVSTWAPAFINDFNPTFSSSELQIVAGWNSDPVSNSGNSTVGVLRNSFTSAFPDKFDFFAFSPTRTDAGGAWLYRDISVSVPEPSVSLLLGSGLLGLGLFRIRKPRSVK